MQAAFGRLDKFHQFTDIGRAIELRADLFEGLRRVEFGAQQEAKCAFDCIEALAIEAPAFEPDRVHTVAMGLALGNDTRKRRHVLGDDGASSDVGVAANAAELVHGAERPDVRIILDDHMASKCRPIRENGVVADDAIVCDVGIRHKEIAAADPGHAAALRGAAAHRGKFPKTVRVAHHEFRALTAKFQVLRISADRAKRIKNVFAADARRPANHGVRLKHAIVPQLNLVSDDGERAYPHSASDMRA